MGCLDVASFRSFHYFIVQKGKLLCQNQSLLKNLRLFKKSSQARIGGARAAGRNHSHFATARTKAPGSRQRKLKSPRPGPLPGAVASIRRTPRSVTARMPDCDRRPPAPDGESGYAPFFRKSWFGSATFSTERSRPPSGLRSRAVFSRRARRFTTLPA